MSSTVHALAGHIAVIGGLGTVSMALYKAASLRADLEMIPATALPRVRWWSTHASAVLTVSLALAVLGLSLLAAT
ncbi:hypothetical protein ABZ490_40365 [Streptomyces sp. NPDC005811]|uniref:hypothetical protein n=1 Tax=Streptomyces sp. NPDC005811 TaxID=3154565 RepID=UPI0033D12B20